MVKFLNFGSAQKKWVEMGAPNVPKMGAPFGLGAPKFTPKRPNYWQGEISLLGPPGGVAWSAAWESQLAEFSWYLICTRKASNELCFKNITRR